MAISGIILSLGIAYIVFVVANILFHSIGIYLLFCLRTSGEETNERLFITNLSVFEVFGNMPGFCMFWVSFEGK